MFLVGLAGATWWVTRVPAVDYQVQPTRLFEQVVSHVRSFGVDSLGEAELFRRAAEGLVTELGDEFASLTPRGERHTPSIDPGGLGLQFTIRSGALIVLGVPPLSPAWHAGLEPGDQIMAIGGVSVRAPNRDLILAALDGPADSTVRLQVRRPGPGTVLDLELRRETPRPFRASELVSLGQGTYYLAIHQAGPGVAEVLGRSLRLLPADARGLALDLRGAAGGSLEEATALVDLFLAPGEPVLRIRGRDSLPTSYSAQHDLVMPTGVALVVLVSPETADAPELLAGALQDHDRALLIGDPTFGRGVSQEEFTLSNQWVIRMSTVRWETPMGRSLQMPEPGDSVARLEDRPIYATAAGRPVRGGGGVVPDSVRKRLPTPPGWVELLRAVGPSFPGLLQAMDSLAVESPGVTPSYRPTVRDLALLFERLRGQGIRPAQDIVAQGAGEFGRLLGDRLVLTRLGEAGWVRRAAVLDPDLRDAIELLRTARNPSALVHRQ